MSKLRVSKLYDERWLKGMEMHPLFEYKREDGVDDKSEFPVGLMYNLLV